jgi:predicted GNAT family acetyltransferase
MDMVNHRVEQNMFVIEVDGHQAELHYRLTPQASGVTAIDFNSTFVPPAFRGKGLAEKLVRAGIKWAKGQGYELHASCWYAAKFIR